MTLNPCCSDPENREDGPGPRGLDAPPPPEVTVTHCRVCECRHFEAVLDPGQLGLKGAEVL
jgi:hypothetical protein